MNYISTSLKMVQAIIANDTAALLAAMETARAPFTSVGFAFTGMLKNPPQAWVMPHQTAFDPEGQRQEQSDLVTVKLGIVAGEPELLVASVLDYVAAVDTALRNATVSELDPSVLRLFVQMHDYGPLFSGEKGGFAVFPEMHLVVERLEVS